MREGERTEGPQVSGGLRTHLAEHVVREILMTQTAQACESWSEGGRGRGSKAQRTSAVRLESDAIGISSRI